nr:MAG TPA: hypothetical protein [Caudoviricetes sp.]
MLINILVKLFFCFYTYLLGIRHSLINAKGVFYGIFNI